MYMIRRKPPDVSGAGLLLRGPPLSPGVVRGVGTTSRDPLPRAPLSVGASAAEWEILDGKRDAAAPRRACLAAYAKELEPYHGWTLRRVYRLGAALGAPPQAPGTP